MKFNTQLINLRKLFGYNQKDFSNLVKISQKNISSWEQGKTEPFYKDLKKLANFFDISLVFLVEGKCVTDNDFVVQEKLNNYLLNNSKSLQFSDILSQAEKIIKEFKLNKPESYLPFIDDENEVNLKYFKIVNSKLLFDKAKIIADKNIYLYLKVFKHEAILKDAVKLDNCEVLDYAIKNLSEAIKDFDDQIAKADEEDKKQLIISKNHYLKNNSLNYCLENLPKEMSNYFHFIIMLIDNGAYYEKQVGAGDKMTTFKLVKDVSKTNFFYKIAKLYV